MTNLSKLPSISSVEVPATQGAASSLAPRGAKIRTPELDLAGHCDLHKPEGRLLDLFDGVLPPIRQARKTAHLNDQQIVTNSQHVR